MHLHVVVRGRVQGVGFRWFVREAARALGVAGWVRNHPDGSVEVAATGEEAAIRSLRMALATGPTEASIATVDDIGTVVDDLPIPFSVRR